MQLDLFVLTFSIKMLISILSIFLLPTTVTLLQCKQKAITIYIGTFKTVKHKITLLREKRLSVEQIKVERPNIWKRMRMLVSPKWRVTDCLTCGLSSPEETGHSEVIYPVIDHSVRGDVSRATWFQAIPRRPWKDDLHWRDTKLHFWCYRRLLHFLPCTVFAS